MVRLQIALGDNFINLTHGILFNVDIIFENLVETFISHLLYLEQRDRCCTTSVINKLNKFD
jgi:hypothetical protein